MRKFAYFLILFRFLLRISGRNICPALFEAVVFLAVNFPEEMAIRHWYQRYFIGAQLSGENDGKTITQSVSRWNYSSQASL